MNILELFARIGLKADQGPANAFLKTVNGIKGELVGVISGTLSLAAAVKAMNSAMSQALEFKKFAAETGASAQELQKWAAVAESVSGSGDAVAASIRAITSNQEAIKLGKGNISGYQLLGIDPRSDPFAVLEKLRGKLQGLSPAMRRNVAAQFGISPDLVMTLELTNAEFDKMAARAWIIPQSSINGLNKARAAIAEVKNAFAFIQAELATKFGPVIEKVTKWVISFALMVERAVLMIDKMVRASIGWKAALAGIVAILALLNAQFLLSPIGIFTMAIVLLMAILEDMYVYSQGGKSLFGVLMKEFPKFAEVVGKIGKVFTDIKDAITALFSGDMSKFDAIVEKWGLFGVILQEIVHTFQYLNDLMKDPIATLKKDFADTQEFNAVSIERVKAFFKGEMAFKDLFKPIQAGEAGTRSSTTTVAPTINIYGATDPTATGAAVTRELQTTLDAAQASRIRAKGE